MNKNWFKLVFLFSVVSLCWSPIASAGQDFRKKLIELDAFHPPVPGDAKNHLYKEWHYFTMTSKTGDFTFSTIFTMEGDTNDVTKSYALKIENYQTSVKSDLTLDIFPIDAATWFSDKPDYYLDKNSISYDGKAYQIRTESADGKVVFDAKWKPVLKPEKAVSLPMKSSDATTSHVMNWLIASAQLEVEGRLVVEKGTASEKVYQFKDARGYHDHNWGYWDWADNFGWDWGQAVEKEGPACKSKIGRWKDSCKKQKRHTLALLNMTDSADTEVHSSVLKLWADEEKIKTFSDNQLSIKNKFMSIPEIPGYYIPETNFISAGSGRDRLDVIFRTQSYFPIYLPIENGYRIIWELKGIFEVAGYVNGKPVKFVTDGSMEYLGAPLLTN